MSSPNASNGNNEYNVTTSGASNNNNSNNANGVAPDYAQHPVTHGSAFLK